MRDDALGALVDRQEDADAVAGAVVVVHPRHPERPRGRARRGRAREAPWPADAADRDHALQDAGEAGALFLGRCADGDGAGDVGRAVDILAARVDQEKLARAYLAVRAVGHAVVDDGAVRARAADRVEADVVERVRGAAEAFERLDDVDLGQLALRRLAVEPGEEFDHRRAVAQMGLGRGGEFDLVLARLSAGCRDPRPRRPRRPRPGGCGTRRGGRWPCRRGRDLSARQRGFEGFGRVGGRCRRRGQAARPWRGREQRHAGVGVEDREGVDHRVLRDVRAADVQKPRRSSRAASGRPPSGRRRGRSLRSARACRRGFAGEFDGMRHDAAHAGGAAGPPRCGR
jgi:hypothetical protein